MPTDNIPEFLTRHNYQIAQETPETTVYFKTVLASAQMNTGFGTFTVTMRPTELLIHRDMGDNSYRFGIRQGKQREVSAPFNELEFQEKLADFEAKLNA